MLVKLLVFYKNFICENDFLLTIMKTIVIDDNAHEILKWAKKNAKKKGIEKPTHSSAIRWLRDAIKELETLNKQLSSQLLELKYK